MHQMDMQNAENGDVEFCVFGFNVFLSEPIPVVTVKVDLPNQVKPEKMATKAQKKLFIIF